MPKTRKLILSLAICFATATRMTTADVQDPSSHRRLHRPGVWRSKDARAARVTGQLLHDDTDSSPEAELWRNHSRTKRARELMSALPWQGASDKLLANPLDPTSVVSVAQLAFGFEVAQGFVGLERRIPGIRVGKTEGMMFFGVKTEQSVVDAAVIQNLLYQTKTDLLIEVGTYCGGSAFIYSKIMRAYNPNATVVTIDITNPEKGWCYQNDAVRKPAWKSLVAAGRIVSLIGSVDSNNKKGLNVRQRLQDLVQNAASVMVIDDADHLKPTTVSRFHQISKHVTVGNYYILQDTRLDYDCAYAQLTRKRNWQYCGDILDRGGAGMAAEELKHAKGFTQDRSVEYWRITQHPGGYLKRVSSATV